MPSTEARRLCETTERALNEAIKLCGPGVPYSAIGKVRLLCWMVQYFYKKHINPCGVASLARHTRLKFWLLQASGCCTQHGTSVTIDAGV